MKKAIAMKCNQEQFDAVETKLVDLKIKAVTGFENANYLTNCFKGNPNVISNITKHGLADFQREVFEEWDENVFLDACGIETETVLEVGKWYKHPIYPKFLTSLRNNKTRFGFDMYGNWFDDGGVIKQEHEKAYFEAKKKEVLKVLKIEAVKRGFGLDIPFVPVNITEKTVVPCGDLRFGFDIKENKLLLNNWACFINGIWAEIKYPKTNKPKKPNRLKELEKRISVLENKVDLKKIADMPENPFKKDVSNFHSDMVDAMQHAMGVPNELIIGSGNFSNNSSGAFIKAFDSIDTNPVGENIKLKSRIEELEAEIKHILAGGKSKWEKEIEELKKANHKLEGNVDFWRKECQSMRDFIKGIKNTTHNFLGMK